MAGGRPTTTASERRNDVATVRLTAAERARLDSRAAALGLRVSDFIRAAALDSLPPKLAKATRSSSGILSKDELRELNAIGVNMNQIARVLNTGSGREIEDDLSDAIGALQAILARYLK